MTYTLRPFTTGGTLAQVDFYAFFFLCVCLKFANTVEILLANTDTQRDRPPRRCPRLSDTC